MPGQTTAAARDVKQGGLSALFSGLRPPKQLERSKLFIYHDDSVKVRRKSEEPSQGARPSAVTALSPGGWQLPWGGSAAKHRLRDKGYRKQTYRAVRVHFGKTESSAGGY